MIQKTCCGFSKSFCTSEDAVHLWNVVCNVKMVVTTLWFLEGWFLSLEWTQFGFIWPIVFSEKWNSIYFFENWVLAWGYMWFKYGFVLASILIWRPNWLIVLMERPVVLGSVAMFWSICPMWRLKRRPHVRVSFLGLRLGSSASSSRPGKKSHWVVTICFPLVFEFSWFPSLV